MSLNDKLNHARAGYALFGRTVGNKRKVEQAAACFCEHDGIFIRFSRAGSLWRALAPCTTRPWWLKLKP